MTATLPTPHGKHLGRAVSCAGLEKKGCLQNKGHLHQTRGRSQMRQRGGRGAKGEWLLRKTLVWLVNQKWGSWDRLWGKLGRSFWQAVLQGQREVSMGKSGMVEKGRQEATETGIKTKRKLSKKHQLLWPQSSPKHRNTFAWWRLGYSSSALPSEHCRQRWAQDSTWEEGANERDGLHRFIHKFSFLQRCLSQGFWRTEN